MVFTIATFIIGVFSIIIIALYILVSYIINEHERDEERSRKQLLKSRTTIENKGTEDMWNEGMQRYDTIQERYEEVFNAPNLNRDASYMREIEHNRYNELLPIWEEKADEALNKILDEIERSVLNYETKTEFFWSRELWDGDKNVLNILVDKIDELGYDTAIHESDLLYVALPDEESWDSSDD